MSDTGPVGCSDRRSDLSDRSFLVAKYRPMFGMGGASATPTMPLFFFRSTLVCTGGGRPVAGSNLAGRPAAAPHTSRDSLYGTAVGRRQERAGVNGINLAPMPRWW